MGDDTINRGYPIRHIYSNAQSAHYAMWYLRMVFYTQLRITIEKINY